MSTEVYLENLSGLERTYESCLGDEPTPAASFISRIIRMEYATDISEQNLFAIYLKLCGNNYHLDAIRLIDSDLPPLLKALQEKPCITVLDLRYNRLTNKGAMHIADFLANDNVLEELNLMGNDIEHEGASALANALRTNKTLVILKMPGNPIGQSGGLSLARALQENETLEFLDLGECDQDITSCIAFATMLRCNRAILGINLNRQLLWTSQEEVTVHIADMLCVNKTLKELHLAKCNIRDFGAERLSDAMERNDSLELLDLSANRVARDGAVALSKVIMFNCSLVILDLAYNRIQCKGAKALANALLSNTRLKVLAVQYCELRGMGLCALAEALITNKTLECIYIWGNEHDESTCIAFSNLIETNRLLEANTDVRPYVVDNRTYLSLADNDCSYRLYRFSVPWWKFQAPNDRSIALF